MVDGKALLFQALVIIFSLSAASIVEAACCVRESTGCSIVSTEADCGVPRIIFDSGSCNALSECKIGCCCEFGTSSGTGKLRALCSGATQTFKENPGLNVGDTCSCDLQYSISGFVSRSGSGISGATVSVGSISAISGSDGAFTLNNVPVGAVVVNAHKSGTCFGSVSFNLVSDVSAIIVDLYCYDCIYGSCNFTTNAYCNESGKWVSYDLSVPAHNQTYCSYACAKQDPDCGEVSDCAGGDFSCPLSCSGIFGSSNYDYDCVCDGTTPNGVCPASCAYGVDADCKIYSPVCNDNEGLVTYPYESCEKNPALGQMSLCSGDLCVNCNCVGLGGCGNNLFEPESGEDCEMGMKCPDGSSCANCKCGGSICTGVFANPTVSLGFDAANRQVTANWALADACKSKAGSYVIYECEKASTKDCADYNAGFRPTPVIPPIMNKTFFINQNSEYCYYVWVSYGDFAIGKSEIKCQSTGNFYCMEQESDAEFCTGNARSRCDAKNNIETMEDCGKSKFCMGPDREGVTSCNSQGVCDQCNGLFGMFASLDLVVKVDSKNYFCLTGAGRNVVSGCYLDRTKTLFNAFDYCGEVTSCYDFKSKEACINTYDPCKKNLGCEWAWLDDNNHYLGGVCRPSNPKLQNCEYCDNPSYNWLTPLCTPSICRLFGSCYYLGDTGTTGVTSSCTSTVTAACLDYSTQPDCTGGSSVLVNVIYGNNTRVDGTHTITKSNDKLHLGKCAWNDLNKVCYKNADNIPVNFDTKAGFDCKEGDFLCESDFSDPNTTILPANWGVYSAKPKIKYVVNDNSYPGNKIETFFCLTRTSCYPNELGVAGEYIPPAKISGSGKYKLFFYSQDPAKNLELVKSIQLIVDADNPFIDLTSPGNVSEFPTNQVNVSVIGKTSPDSKYVCARNQKTNTTRCINNCAIVKGLSKIGCFSDSTGIFDLTITVGGTDLTNVLFYAEDFAGNTYQNTLLGILLDIEPPAEPSISIY